MTGRILVAALALVIVPWGPASLHRTVSAQVSPPERMAIVASDSSLHLQVWRAGAAGFEKVWKATPRVVDPATWDKRRSEAIASARDSGMEIADLDGDGANELVIADAYGLTVYGRSLAYYPFPSSGDGAPSFSVADVDGDGVPEVVTERTLSAEPAGGGEVQREVEVLKPGPGGLMSIWKHDLPGGAAAIAVGDVDNDGEKEIVSGAVTLTILKRRPGPKWEAVAQLPTTPPTAAS